MISLILAKQIIWKLQPISISAIFNAIYKYQIDSSSNDPVSFLMSGDKISRFMLYEMCASAGVLQ